MSFTPTVSLVGLNFVRDDMDEVTLTNHPNPIAPHQPTFATVSTNCLSETCAHYPSGRVRELEEKRINKEMANIRSKFKGSTRRQERALLLVSLTTR